ncbi:MAG: hypothetical protein HY744_06110 [Deltaproteobacteria bacterium]|nr:hypothetical protein [Deltaproteobacteria bacterium]
MKHSLKTARVPADLAPAFAKAERVVSRYFRRRVEDPSHGRVEISGERYVLVRAASLSVEFFALVEKLYGAGREVEAQEFARNILFDLAHAIGKSDARKFHETMGLSDPIAKLSAGPIHFSHCGWAFVDIAEGSVVEASDEYCIVYEHPYSFESDAWLRAGRRVAFPVCIMNAGYSSGWCEESFGLALVAGELLCRAKGDESCRFLMAPPDRIAAQIERYIGTQPDLAERMRGYRVPGFFARQRMEQELREARDELEQRVVERTAALRRATELLRQEIAERARVERRLHETERLEALGRLAGGIAHDFNNLLGAILGTSTMLERRVAPDDPTQPMLRGITEAAQLAANLPRQLLTFSRSRRLDKQQFDVGSTWPPSARQRRDFLLAFRLAGSHKIGLCHFWSGGLPDSTWPGQAPSPRALPGLLSLAAALRRGPAAPRRAWRLHRQGDARGRAGTAAVRRQDPGSRGRCPLRHGPRRWRDGQQRRPLALAGAAVERPQEVVEGALHRARPQGLRLGAPRRPVLPEAGARQVRP